MSFTPHHKGYSFLESKIQKDERNRMKSAQGSRGESRRPRLPGLPRGVTHHGRIQPEKYGESLGRWEGEEQPRVAGEPECTFAKESCPMWCSVGSLKYKYLNGAKLP